MFNVLFLDLNNRCDGSMIYAGKSCKLSSTVGHKETTVTVVGGDEFTVDMGELKAAKMEAIADLVQKPPPVDPK